MRLEPADFHDLISHCRVLNGEIMKTMAKRVGRIQQVVAESTTIAATLIGRRQDAACLQARDFLARNHIMFAWRDLDDTDALDRLVYDEVITSRADVTTAFANTTLPLVILADGRRLEAPSSRELARRYHVDRP